MNTFAFVLIATLLAGCVATRNQVSSEKPNPISMHSWQLLQSALKDSPAELRSPIAEEAEARLQNFPEAEPVTVTESQKPQALLFDILMHTRNQHLLPDAEFARLHSVVSGENQPLQQAYAAALTGYLMHADFSCQQPIYARYFTRHFASERGIEPCRAEVPFSMHSQSDGTSTFWLDPKRVSAIHLIFASKSDSMASRFGHVAVRLVVCPEGKASAAVCDANLAEHVVLGFRAHIDELSLNTLKALNGEYRAYLFANHFMDVYQEYAIDEFRELYSLPLLLNDTEREAMVRQLADIHWGYAGKYSFFGNNCASMLQQALRVTWPEFTLDSSMKSDFLRPDTLFETIKSSPLADAEKLASLDSAERNGYFFSSTRQFYDRAVAEVSGAMTAPLFKDLDGYLQIYPVKRRQGRAADLPFSALLAVDRHLREANIMLEEYAILRSERLLLIEAAKYLEELAFLPNADKIASQLDSEHAKVFNDCLLAPIRQQARPVRNLNGIPDKADLPVVSTLALMCQSPQSKKLLREAITGINDAKSEQWQRLNEIAQYCAESIDNLNLLKQL